MTWICRDCLKAHKDKQPSGKWHYGPCDFCRFVCEVVKFKPNPGSKQLGDDYEM